MKLQRKLLLSYLIVVLLPLLSTTYFIIDKITKETINQSVLVNRVNYEQLNSNVNNLINTYTTLSGSISTENPSIQYLTNNPTVMDNYASRYFLFHDIQTKFSAKYALYSAYDVNISFYSNNPSILYDNDFIKQIDENIKSEQWYKDTLASKELNNILTPFIDSAAKYRIPITRVVDNTNGIINILKIDIPEASLWELIKNERSTKKIYILNTVGDILSSTSRNLIGSNISNTGIQIKASSSNVNEPLFNIFSTPSNLTFNETLKTKFYKNQCRVITTIPSSIILGKTNEIIKYGAIVCLISTLVAIIFILIFSSTFVRRLKLLVSNMSKIKEGNFNVYVSFQEKDEIGELSRSFKSMLDRLNILINEVYTNNLRLKDLEIDKKEAKLQALQSQMNPHFLFNTLESIRMNVLKNGDSETSEVIENFGILLRTSIEWKDHFIPLNLEIEFVEKYLKIQSFRYRNRFSFNINLSSKLLNITVPKFILQPIVENAIYHGVEMKKGKGIINIYGYIINNDMKIIVQDNGVGITKLKLSELISSIEDSHNINVSKSIGMRNVNQRLKLLYGDHYGITIYSKEKKGTKIQILLPTDKKGLI